MKGWVMCVQVCLLGIEFGVLYKAISLTDIDECFDDPCDTNATCTNTDGSYMCACNTGFSGDGEYCTSKCAEYQMWYTSSLSVLLGVMYVNILYLHLHGYGYFPQM